MSSAVATAQKLLYAQISTVWAGRTPVRWPNVDFIPPTDGSPWLAVDLMWGDGFARSMGEIGSGARNFMVGVLQLTVFGPTGEARGVTMALVDVARDIVNRVIISGVRCDVPSAPMPGSGELAWDSVIVRVPIEIEETV